MPPQLKTNKQDPTVYSSAVMKLRGLIFFKLIVRLQKKNRHYRLQTTGVILGKLSQVIHLPTQESKEQGDHL